MVGWKVGSNAQDIHKKGAATASAATASVATATAHYGPRMKGGANGSAFDVGAHRAVSKNESIQSGTQSGQQEREQEREQTERCE